MSHFQHSHHASVDEVSATAATAAALCERSSPLELLPSPPSALPDPQRTSSTSAAALKAELAVASYRPLQDFGSQLP